MKIAVIGTGYVGLVSGVCLADLGHRVICIDTDKDKIGKLEEGQIPIYEPGLKELVDSNVKAGRLSFSTNLIDYIDVADAVMIAVGTPMSDNGSTDLKYVMEVADEIAFGMNETEREEDLLVIMKSTVPAGTNDKVRDRILSKLDKGRRHLLHMASNPEFLKEGTAVNDFKHPDRIVIGYSDGYAKRLMTELYCPEGNGEFADKLFFTVNIKSAELIKYASNCMLMSKVIFIDLIAKYCEAIGADVEDVAAGMGLDKRIGPAFLKAGPGTSGSCFIKDCKSLIYEFDSAGIKNRLLEGVDKENRLMFWEMFDSKKREWIAGAFRKEGFSIDAEGIEEILFSTENNTADMKNLVNSLSLYFHAVKPDKKAITAEDIEQYAVKTRGEDGYTLFAAIA